MRRNRRLIVALLTCTPALGQVEFLEETFEYDKDYPPVGYWIGNVTTPASSETILVGALEIKLADDRYALRMTLLGVGALNKECVLVAARGSALTFDLVAAGGMYRFVGEIDAAGQRFAGKVSLVDEADDGEEHSAFEFARSIRPTDLPDPLAFTGELDAQGMKLGMSIILARTPAGNWVGHIDVPMHVLNAFPLINLSEDEGVIHAVMAVPGDPAIDVSLDEHKQHMTGTFKQSGMELEIAFVRDVNYAYKELPRPQHPKPPYPYEVREVSIEHPDGHRLAGTLTVPAGQGPHPAAVLISGSGPQDRDETLLGHKPFLVIADYLTRHGIAVLRYDDRGTGQSTGEFSTATTQDFATDALAAVNYITTQDGVDPKRFGLIGHSEGAMVGPMVAGLTADVAFVVLLAGPGVPGDELLRVQLKLVMQAGGAPEQAIQTALAQQAQFFELVRQGASAEDLREAMRPVLEAQMKAMGVSDDEELPERLIEVQLDQLTSPWMRFFLTYDPRPALAKIKCPVLACNGTLDLQVWHEQNLDVIEQTITEAGGDVTAKRYEGLNHLFQPATTGSIAEYATIEITFDETVLRDIVQWIKRKVTDSKPRTNIHPPEAGPEESATKVRVGIDHESMSALPLQCIHAPERLAWQATPHRRLWDRLVGPAAV
ncbi:MAG: alpha/beta fold hydrolase [Planctomycetota bacterium]|nr:alpha/beta fold hydrolase [Planctomycetota bacterium]